MIKFLLKIFLVVFVCLPANSEIKRISEGNVDSKIQIIVYESLTCTHCANFHKNVYPDLKKEFIDTGNIFVEYRNFPLDLASGDVLPVALTAPAVNG